MTRALRLRRQTLAELTSTELASVAGAVGAATLLCPPVLTGTETYKCTQ